jgi:hypothetical protein
MKVSSAVRCLLSFPLLSSSLWVAPGGAQEPEGEDSGGRLLVIPMAGMFVSGAPTETNQVYGLHLWFLAGNRVAVEGWAHGHWGGSMNGAGVAGGDFLWNFRGDGRLAGASTLAGVSRWPHQTVLTTGFRLRGGMLAEGLDESGEAQIPPIQLWLELRGGIASPDAHEGGRSRGFGIASVALVLPIRAGAWPAAAQSVSGP